VILFVFANEVVKTENREPCVSHIQIPSSRVTENLYLNTRKENFPRYPAARIMYLLQLYQLEGEKEKLVICFHAFESLNKKWY
jgi:hypothetical protein